MKINKPIKINVITDKEQAELIKEFELVAIERLGYDPRSKANMLKQLNDSEWQEWAADFGHDELRSSFLVYWDPIGIYGVLGAKDEYDGYLEPVLNLLHKDVCVKDLAQYLMSVEMDEMGLRGDYPRAEKAARQIAEWFLIAMYRLETSMLLHHGI